MRDMDTTAYVRERWRHTNLCRRVGGDVVQRQQVSVTPDFRTCRRSRGIQRSSEWILRQRHGKTVLPVHDQDRVQDPSTSADEPVPSPRLTSQHRDTHTALPGDAHLRCQGRRHLATESAAAARRLGQSAGPRTPLVKYLTPAPVRAELQSIEYKRQLSLNQTRHNGM